MASNAEEISRLRDLIRKLEQGGDTKTTEKPTKKRKKRKVKSPIDLYSGGLPVFDDKEQVDYVDNKLDDDLPITSAQGGFTNPKTGKVSKIILQDHQKQFLLKFINGDRRGAVVFHGTGSGKTITAVSTASAFLRFNPTSKVYVITPSATQQNFIFGMKQWGLSVRDNRYEFHTYAKFYRGKVECEEGCLIIVDEAHNFRSDAKSLIVDDEEDITGFKKNKRLFPVLKCASKAKSVMLLTATPYVNEIYDVFNMMWLIDSARAHDFENKVLSNYMPKKLFYSALSNRKNWSDMFGGNISNFQKPISSDDWPRVVSRLVPVVMDDTTADKYLKIKQSAFYSKERAFVDSHAGLKSDKIERALDIIDEGGRSVVYTAFLGNGVKLLKQGLDDMGIDYAVISGKQTALAKEIAKNRYNHFLPQNKAYRKRILKLGLTDETYPVDVLIITNSATEGVDLIGTKNMILVDGGWNEATMEQVQARGIRFRSHAHLPKKEQVVYVYRILSTLPRDSNIVEHISANKFPSWSILLDAILADKEARKSNKRGKSVYAWPSVDLYMYIRSQAKQSVIGNFTQGLDDITKFEGALSPAEIAFNKEVSRKVKSKKRTLTVKELDAIRKEVYDEDYAGYVEQVETHQAGTEKAMRDILVMADKKRKSTFRKMMKTNQQQFKTPPFLADEMVKRAGIRSDKRDRLRILDPTACEGALVLPIVEQIARSGVQWQVDMIELLGDNCDVLDDIGLSNIKVVKETNFFKYIPVEGKYDYVLLNPPKLLKRSKNKRIFERDIKDTDWLKRAFGMLAVGGKLIALMSKDSVASIAGYLKDKNSDVESIDANWGGRRGDANIMLVAKIGLVDYVFLTMTMEERNRIDLMPAYGDILVGEAPEMLTPSMPLDIAVDGDKLQTVPVQVLDDDDLKIASDLREPAQLKKKKRRPPKKKPRRSVDNISL